MTEQLKACPFCGKHCQHFTDDGFPEMCLYKTCSGEEFIKQWNTRPLEDALQARITELTEQCNLLFDNQDGISDSLIALRQNLCETVEEIEEFQNKFDIRDPEIVIIIKMIMDILYKYGLIKED